MNRTIYRVLLILSFLALNGLILFGLSSVWSYLNTGADRSKMLHLPQELSANYLPKIEWEPLENDGRPMEKQTLDEIERDYLKAWQIRNIALENNSEYGVADYYTDSARVKLFSILDLNRTKNTTVKSATLRHRPKLEFYSTDGKIIVLTDTNVERYEEIYLNDNLILKQKSTSSYQIMLLLEDGFWRIRHFVEIPSSKTKTIPQKKNTSFDVSISKIRGINYYPKKTPWNMFGKQFQDSIIDRDFSKIKTLGLNTVRIFVPYDAFGKAEVDFEKLEQLKRTLDLATRNDLKVMVTLFDFYGDYGIQDWTISHRHAEQIVTELKNHKALLAWDIKNEPDLDFKSRGKEKVLAWLEQMISSVNEWDKLHPVTIGWSSPEVAFNLSQEVDFVSFHYYRDAPSFPKAYEELKNKVPSKNLVLQEFGYSSYDGIWNAFLGSQENQAKYHTEIQKTLEENNIPFLFWTLYDFEEIPSSVVGKLPWRKARQKHFGIFDFDGKQKTVYPVIITRH
ncbi:cellulase family glycosylhydrolase [Maribacter sp. HTCC2170]|uniref:cellulase family glycosylhydrolase n=1 Tax=Maribacter sp. (strain HTCC2170 / KCCM 42371) TaxID=313603 RepID=UPI000320D2D9|nr:cellulase family glycosylhydrolase [Maribacter sp. HTCC2170]